MSCKKSEGNNSLAHFFLKLRICCAMYSFTTTYTREINHLYPHTHFQKKSYYCSMKLYNPWPPGNTITIPSFGKYGIYWGMATLYCTIHIGSNRTENYNPSTKNIILLRIILLSVRKKWKWDNQNASCSA